MRVVLIIIVSLSVQLQPVIRKVTITKTIFIQDGKTLEKKSETHFNLKGKKIREVSYDSKLEKIASEHIFTYNSDNQLVYQKEVDLITGNFTETFLKYLSDKREEPDELVQINSEGKVIFMTKQYFNLEDRLLLLENRNTDDTTKVDSNRKYYYHQNGCLKATEWYFDNALMATTEYSYDSSDRVTKIVELNEGMAPRLEEIEYFAKAVTHNIFFKHENRKIINLSEKYDLRKNLLKRIYFSSNGKPYKEVTFCNEYDANLNLMYSEEYENGKAKSITNYDYEYF